MAQKPNSSHDKTSMKLKESQSGLPVPIHPDDAKDKVFTAILKALLKMGNKPSSPKELANIIVKYKYATLGGATPFATVSSRISQHFKRAAEHNPPRAPLLAKHVDQKHSRKINYSLATESVSNNNDDAAETHDTAAKNEQHEEEEEEEVDYLDRNIIREHDPARTNSKIRRIPPTIQKQEEDHRMKKHKLRHQYNQKFPMPSSSQPTLESTSTLIHDDSESEHSDYHEDMLKGDDLDVNISSRQSTLEKNTIQTASSTKSTMKTDNSDSDNVSHEILNISSTNTSKSKLLTPPQDNFPSTSTAEIRKPSFSFGGEQELWTPFSFEHDFDNVFLNDHNNIPLNIATPESISISELDNYFANSTTSSLSHSKRKSFSSTMLGPNDKSLLQKVLLASAARGVAEKNDEDPQKGKLETIIESSTEYESTATTDTTVADTKKPEKPAETFSTSSLMDVTNGEDFVKFEEDEKKEVPVPPSTKKMTEILPATSTPPTSISAAEILKSMNIQNLNLAALQQVTSNIPSLQHLSSTLDLAKTMAAYMQSLAKSASASSSPSSSTHAMDLKTILTRFPVLEAFIKKDLAMATPTGIPPLISPAAPELNKPATTTTTLPTPSFTTGSTEPIVHTLTPTNPPMYITLIDNVAVCIVVLEKTDTTPEYRIMRRVDSGFINGTVLLTAGGIETESERSMILSFEMERVRMPKKKSPLFGTWIPLRRAQELAVTCSVQQKIGHFLDDSIESYFPSPLPIPVAPRKPIRDSRLTALALAALRSDSAKNNEFIVPPISRQSSSSGSMASTQLQELLMSHPHKALKSFNEKNPLLLGHDQDEITALPPSVTTKRKQSTTSSHSNEKEESDVDVVNSDSSQLSSNEEESDHEATRKVNQPPTTLSLEELLSRVASKQPMHIHPRDLQKKRRRHSVGSKQTETDDDEPVNKQGKGVARKKPSNGGGKWLSGTHTGVAIKKSASVSGTTITIKRSQSNTIQRKKESLSSFKSVTKKTDENVVVQHNNNPIPSAVKSETPPSKASKSTDEEEDEDDEDIDIGGSDCDDDLR